jgi:hypothetical protein
MHLVLLIHGVNGYADDLEYIENKIKDISNSVVVVTPICNQGSTHSGIEDGAERYYQWFKEYSSQNTVTELSIIGHSLGGLYARFLIGLLYKRKWIPGRLKANLFISLSTPHLPIRLYDRFVYPKLSGAVAKALIGKTGAEMLMIDSTSQSQSFADLFKGNQKNDVSSLPMLIRLCEEEFIKGLECFSKLICYANIKYDPVVNYGNACLTRNDYCTKQANLQFRGEELPHIFQHFVTEMEYDNREDAVENLLRLGNLPWLRFGIVPSRAIVAHADMINKFKYSQLIIGNGAKNMEIKL